VPAQGGKEPIVLPVLPLGLNARRVSVVVVAAGLVFCERLRDRMLFEKRK
jgi:hypothetical protein